MCARFSHHDNYFKCHFSLLKGHLCIVIGDDVIHQNLKEHLNTGRKDICSHPTDDDTECLLPVHTLHRQCSRQTSLLQYMHWVVNVMLTAVWLVMKQ